MISVLLDRTNFYQ